MQASPKFVVVLNVLATLILTLGLAWHLGWFFIGPTP